MCVDSGADRGSAERQFGKRIAQFFEAANTEVHLSGVTAEFLSKPDRSSVLQVRSADLYDGIEFICFVRKSFFEAAQRWNQGVFDGFHNRDMHRGWDHVVAGLPHIDMIVWMDRLLRTDNSAKNLNRAIRNH